MSSKGRKNSASASANRKRSKAAAAAARAAAEERERKQATAIGVSVCVAIIAVIVAVVAVVWATHRPAKAEGKSDSASTSLRQARSKVSAVNPSPKHSNSNGGFLFSKNGIDSPAKNVPTVEVYMDFMCPGCGNLDRQLFPTWDKMLAAGQLNLEVHPNGFLDANSSDDYSTRAASAAAYIADNDPQHALTFVKSMFDESFQPKEGPEYKSVSDQAIVDQAKKAGVTSDVAEKSVKGTYTKWIKALATYTPMRPAVQHPDGHNKGEMTTPTLLVNGHYWDYATAAENATSLQDAFVNALGLTPAEVGTSTPPSIGGTKGPKA